MTWRRPRRKATLALHSNTNLAARALRGRCLSEGESTAIIDDNSPAKSADCNNKASAEKDKTLTGTAPKATQSPLFEMIQKEESRNPGGTEEFPVVDEEAPNLTIELSEPKKVRCSLL